MRNPHHLCMPAGDLDPITKEPFPEQLPPPVLQPQQLNIPQAQHKQGSANGKGGSAGSTHGKIPNAAPSNPKCRFWCLSVY